MGLTAADRAREGKRWQIGKVRQILRKLKVEALRCPANMLHKVNLLEAELLALAGKMDEAICMYEQSIVHAHTSKFINEEALANEKAGLALLKCGKGHLSGPFLARARQLYGEWGAEGKVSELGEHISRLGKEFGEGFTSREGSSSLTT